MAKIEFFCDTLIKTMDKNKGVDSRTKCSREEELGEKFER